MPGINSLVNYGLERFHKFSGISYFQKIEMLEEFYWLLKTQLYYRPFFGKIGKGSKIIKPLRLANTNHIQIGDDVVIKQYAWLTSGRHSLASQPMLLIGNGTRIGHFNHITVKDRVELGTNVLTADKVFISDNAHQYQDVNQPVSEQIVFSKGPVSIGDGAWLGENVCVISARIGKNSVIGANSVVISDIPDFSVAVGAPARVVKRYRFESKSWEMVNEAGDYIAD